MRRARHVLFVALAGHGHVTPTLPLVEELVQRGHRVAYATTADFADPIGQRAEVHQEVAELVATALRPLADVLFTSVRVHLPAPVVV